LGFRVVPDDVLVVGIRMLREEALDQVLLLLMRETEHLVEDGSSVFSFDFLFRVGCLLLWG